MSYWRLVWFNGNTNHFIFIASALVRKMRSLSLLSNSILMKCGCLNQVFLLCARGNALLNCRIGHAMSWTMQQHTLLHILMFIRVICVPWAVILVSTIICGSPILVISESTWIHIWLPSQNN